MSEDAHIHDDAGAPDDLHPGRWWHAISDDGQVQCDLCPRLCRPRPGQRGMCYVRMNHEGRMVLTTYGRSSGFCVDPIEKKPLNHFLPGTSVLSFGTAGCNLGCRFCQNWDISKARTHDRLADQASPEAIARQASQLGCRSVAFTYNDPVIFAEYALDVAAACREAGVKTVAVTAGYITDAARPEFYAGMDAANVDLKGFTQEFYEKVCLGDLQPVLDTLVYLKRETRVWFELTTLVIPGLNDSTEDLSRQADWIVEHLGPDVPLHFSAFHPDFKMLDIPRTPESTLRRARQLARDAGLRHVYTGNVHDADGGSTYCHGCGLRLIERDWYELGEWRLDADGGAPERARAGLAGGTQSGSSDDDSSREAGERSRRTHPTVGRCSRCRTPLAGVFEARPGTWGRRRLPVSMGR